MRCPGCGATNPEGAAWCGQCYASLVPAGEADVAPATSVGERESDPEGAPGTSRGPEPESRAGHGPRLRHREDEVEWACARCESWTVAPAAACAVCGAPFDASGPGEESDEPNWTSASILTVLLPGAGHVLLGRYGTGVARIVLFAVWALGGVVVAVGGGVAAVAAAAPLLLGAGAIWVGSLLDVVAVRTGGRELLSGRVLLWLVVAVLVLSGIAVLSAVVSLQTV